eukprot:sb/3477242/
MRRVQEVERGSFTPLVFSTSGGFAAEVRKVLDKAATKICQKHKECYAETMSFIREKTRFSLLVLRSTLGALRGTSESVWKMSVFETREQRLRERENESMKWVISDISGHW